LIERRADLPDEHLHKLDKGGDNQDEGYYLEIIERIRNKNKMVDQPGNDSGDGHDKSDRQSHGKSRIKFFANSQKGTYSQEIMEDEIFDEDG
jgi:hypothetical protein